jgi:alkaline phosphatase
MYKAEQESAKRLRNYSLVKKAAKHLAPAAIHSEASALILFIIEGTGDSRWSKTRLFRSFHTSHPIRSATEREPLHGTPGAVDTLTHHSMVDVLGLHSEGRSSGVPIHVATAVQTQHVYLQSVAMCNAVS